MTGITSKTKYLGDATKTDWVMDGNAVPYKNSLLLTMAPSTVGTVLATSRYMWYGNVKARFKTGRGKGVVTAFILLSDVKDEIDYEYVGVELKKAQTNYYYQGITNCKSPSAYCPGISLLVQPNPNPHQTKKEATSPSPTPSRTTMTTRSAGRPTPSPGSSMARSAAPSSARTPGTQPPTNGHSPKLLPVCKSPFGLVVSHLTPRAPLTGLAA
jgi:hypothetical protein